MADPSMTTVTVDRISNGGNAIAQQEIDGKTVHAPASASVGDTLKVRLTEKDGYFEATLVDRADEIHPRQPGLTPDTSEIGQDLLAPERDESHSFEIRDSLTDGRVGQELRSWAASRKL